MTSKWQTVSTDLKIDSNYGDFEIVNNDLVMFRKSKDILRNTVIERYKTNFNDIVIDPYYGANLDKYIGKGISKPLIEQITNSMKVCLTYDGFVEQGDLTIVPIVLDDNVLRVFTYIEVPGGQVSIASSYDYLNGEITSA